MSLFTPHEYQEQAIDFMVDRLFVRGEAGAGLFLDPGLGKTATTYEALDRLRFFGVVNRVLVVAPLRPVYSVWPNERDKWGFDFSTSIIHGNPNQRVKALAVGADVDLINPEGLAWLFKQDHFPWDTLVVDESTKFKNWMSKRTRALRKFVSRFRSRIILTGTPSPNSLADLFAQIYLLDEGQTLGKTLSYFRSKYMRRGGYMGYQWSVRDKEAEQTIVDAIAPLVLTMRAEDHLDMPPLVENMIWVDLPPDASEEYRRLERELFLQLDSGQDVIASGAGGCYAMCKQLANGGVYENGETRTTHHIHEAKVDALVDLVEELQGKPVLVAYQFKHDLERIKKRSLFKNAPEINGATKAKQVDKIIADWNAGKIRALLCQPKAMSHGLNMQGACTDIAWYGLSDQPEEYTQLIRRIYRQGAKGQVRVHHLLCRGTVEEAMLTRVLDKSGTERSLMQALKEYRSKKSVVSY